MKITLNKGLKIIQFVFDALWVLYLCFGVYELVYAITSIVPGHFSQMLSGVLHAALFKSLSDFARKLRANNRSGIISSLKWATVLLCLNVVIDLAVVADVMKRSNLILLEMRESASQNTLTAGELHSIDAYYRWNIYESYLIFFVPRIKGLFSLILGLIFYRLIALFKKEETLANAVEILKKEEELII